MKLTLNVGCGERTFDDYPEGYKCINIDTRDLSNVDKVMDVRRLEFPDNYFDYILASDIIEHFPISETNDILTEWKRVLKIGGIIEFRMPNLKEICRRYIDGEHDTKLTSWLLFGGQEYPGNFHYVGFDREWFSSICVTCGLEEKGYENMDNNLQIKVRRKG